MSDTDDIKVTHHCTAGEQRIFDAFLDRTVISAWLAQDGGADIPPIEMAPEEGGAFSWPHRFKGRVHTLSGRIMVIDRPHRIVLHLDPPNASKVTIVMLPHPDGGTVITLMQDFDTAVPLNTERVEIEWLGLLRAIDQVTTAGQI